MPSGPVALPKRLIVAIACNKTRYKHSCTSLFIERLQFLVTSRIVLSTYILAMTIACPLTTYVAQVPTVGTYESYHNSSSHITTRPQINICALILSNEYVICIIHYYIVGGSLQCTHTKQQTVFSE